MKSYTSGVLLMMNNENTIQNIGKTEVLEIVTKLAASDSVFLKSLVKEIVEPSLATESSKKRTDLSRRRELTEQLNYRNGIHFSVKHKLF